MLTQAKPASMAMSYEAPAKVSKPSKTSIRVISEMSTPRIATFVAYRHRVGLLGLSTFVLFSYIMYDKLLYLFL